MCWWHDIQVLRIVISWIKYKVSALISKKGGSNIIKTSLVCFQSVGRGPSSMGRLANQSVSDMMIVMFTEETNACNLSTSFNFCWKERLFYIVNTQITVIKFKTYLKEDLAAKIFFVAQFCI